MMDEKNDVEKVDDVILPGFRFHPTDEELVGFYLRRKIQQRPLPIELIKQVDIYKYDPWDLPKLSSTGEKEWYFYCPRDRKYRNSARPNRVTVAGFWKATGTDRPIYSSDSSDCIGLKKSLVFYRGRAAKGIKTDWMMHEFRLPSIADSGPPKKLLDKSFSANDSWAICRIFKKTNSMAHRALSHPWASPLPETTASDILTHGANYTQFSSENISCTTEIRSALQVCCNNDFQQTSSPYSTPFRQSSFDIPNSFILSPLDMSGPVLNPSGISDISKSSESIEFGGSQQQFNGFSYSFPQEMQGNTDLRKKPSSDHVSNQLGTIRSIGFPFSLPANDAWKPTLPWDSPPCPSEMSTSYSTNKCYA